MGPPQHILVVNGPNLNLLGLREPQTYGTTTLDDLVNGLGDHTARKLGLHLSSFQSNHEGEILDLLHSCHPKRYAFPAAASKHGVRSFRPELDGPPPNVDAIVINAGALTHTSVALRDALVGIEIPFIEVHISNVHAREEFRHRSFMCDKAVAVISGLGTYGYVAAIDYFASGGNWL